MGRDASSFRCISTVTALRTAYEHAGERVSDLSTPRLSHRCPISTSRDFTCSNGRAIFGTELFQFEFQLRCSRVKQKHFQAESNTIATKVDIKIILWVCTSHHFYFKQSIITLTHIYGYLSRDVKTLRCLDPSNDPPRNFFPIDDERCAPVKGNHDSVDLTVERAGW